MKKFPAITQKEFEIFETLDTPQKIQDFLNTLPFNFEKKGDTNMSPLETLRAGTAHCMEGAMLACAILWYHGEKPLLLDLKTTNDDFDHVVTLFKKNGLWGALSKTNHGVLRYRDPIYKNVRELVMSYFNEYFLNSNGTKTLRSYSKPFDISRLSPDWLTSSKNLWNIVRLLEKSPHVQLLSPASIKNLRPAEAIEIEMGTITEYKK
jgi:hypothetical protein